MNRRLTQGFTLIELMIVVVVIAILAAIAFPSYKSSVLKTRRSDAKTALTTAATLEERWYTQSTPNSYTDDINNIGGNTSPEGYYDIRVDIPAGASCSVTRTGLPTLYYCYQITATATGAQLDDTNCKKLILDHTGLKTSLDSGDAASTGCW